MFRRFFLLLVLISCAAEVDAQHSFYSRELSFVTDNDAYLFQKKDAYYTNGFFFSLRTAGQHNGAKLVRDFTLGQMIYTPLNRKSASKTDVDRPYCGYLFLQYTQSKFLPKDVVFQYHASIGEIGQSSLGEEVQDSYHTLLGYSRFNGWQYQVQNSLEADLGISYARTVAEDASWIKLVPVAQANLGMTFTNAKIGTYLCLGAFEENANSALWNARIQSSETNTRRNHELFLYWYPQLIVQGYNATIQGGLFNKGNGTAALGDPETLMFQHSIGLCYAQDRWTTHLAFIHQTREAVKQQKAQDYVSVQLSYRLH